MDELIKKLFLDYKSKYVIPSDLKISVQIVDNPNESACEFQEKYNRNILHDSFDYNGTTCVPKTIEQTTAIFISQKEVENFMSNNCQFICTFLHELTHAIDYYNFCKKYCSNNYDELLNNTCSYGFKIWTEFNAKSISYLLYCQYINGDLYNSESALKMILNNELPFQNKLLSDNIKIHDIESAIYEIILYLGRYYIWEKMFEKEFKNGSKFPTILLEIAKEEIIDLYEFIKNYSDTKKFYIELHKKINLLKGKINYNN